MIPASDLYSLGCTLLFVVTRRSPADLPQKRMRFDFRDRFSLSSDLADWLEKMVEPAKEDRFSSAEEALQTLNRKYRFSSVTKDLALTKYRSRKIRTPRNTKSILRRNNHILSVIIPPKAKPPNIDLSLLMEYGYVIPTIFFIVVVLGLSSVFFKLYPLSFWIVFIVLLLINIFQDIWQKFELKIQSDFFTIEYSCLGIKSTTQIGKTHDIVLNVGINKHDYGGDKFCCVIGDGTQKYSFGEGLEKVEIIWLVKEIKDFLQDLQMERK